MSRFINSTLFPAMTGMHNLSRLHNEIDRMFQGMHNFAGFPGEDTWPDVFAQDAAAGFAPHMDVKSNDNAYTMSVELPGVAPEDVKIEIRDNTLTISGEKKEEKTSTDEKGTTHVQERRYGSFMRSLQLPEDADADSIKAVASNGVLTLDIPRRAPKSTVKSIEIQKDAQTSQEAGPSTQEAQAQAAQPESGEARA